MAARHMQYSKTTILNAICRLDKQLQQLQIFRTTMEIEFTKLPKSSVTLEAGQTQMINTLAILGGTVEKDIVLKCKSSSTVQYIHEVFNSRQNASCSKTRQQSFEDQRTRQANLGLYETTAWQNFYNFCKSMNTRFKFLTRKQALTMLSL